MPTFRSHPHVARHHLEEFVTEAVEGRILDWTANHHGDVDGFILDTGELVRFPPHRGMEIVELAVDGHAVTVTGVRHTPPHGDSHVVALLIESDGHSVSLDVAGEPLHRRPIATNHPLHLDASRLGRGLAPIGGDHQESIESRLAGIEERLRQLTDRLDRPYREA